MNIVWKTNAYEFQFNLLKHTQRWKTLCSVNGENEFLHGRLDFTDECRCPVELLNLHRLRHLMASVKQPFHISVIGIRQWIGRNTAAVYEQVRCSSRTPYNMRPLIRCVRMVDSGLSEAGRLVIHDRSTRKYDGCHDDGDSAISHSNDLAAADAIFFELA
jgi:hypothetical protein